MSRQTDEYVRSILAEGVTDKQRERIAERLGVNPETLPGGEEEGGGDDE